jgi:hypothetical protein
MHALCMFISPCYILSQSGFISCSDKVVSFTSLSAHTTYTVFSQDTEPLGCSYPVMETMHCQMHQHI